jgi:ABC-type nitrate/sulfonate/bicarbonate transport system substrate-binding protein
VSVVVVAFATPAVVPAMRSIASMMYPKYGVNLYGNATIVSEQFLKEKPKAVKAFLCAFAKGMKGT